MILKNQSIVITYFAWNTQNHNPRTGDVANHTLRLVKDGIVQAPTNTPSEVDVTNCPGLYKITLTAAETNFDSITLAGKSSTGNTRIDPVHLYTFTKAGYSLANGSVVAATFGVGAIDSNALAVGAITASKFAANAIDAAALAPDAVTEIVNGVFARSIDGKTFAEVSEFILSYTIGKVTKNLDDYTYHKQDGLTPLFVLRSAATSRTRIV